MYPIIEVFGREIGTYGISAFVGLFVCAWVALKLSKQYGMTLDDVILMAVSMGVGLFLGAHIFFGITKIPFIIKLFSYIGKISFIDFMKQLIINGLGGMVFYGGLFGGMIGFFVYARLTKMTQEKRRGMLDVIAVCIPLFHTFGRIGCFFGGCCYGMESRFGYIIHENKLIPEVAGVRRFPVQLIESGCNLLIFFLLLALFKKGKFKNQILFVYLPIYAVVRFTLEFFRGDLLRGIWFGLSTSQWVSIGLLAFSLVRLIVVLVKKKDNTLSDETTGDDIMDNTDTKVNKERS